MPAAIPSVTYAPGTFPADLREDPLSGVIYAVLVVVWAAVLVPMWVRRHDAADESRSGRRFAGGMRILPRRSAATGDARYVVMPHRPVRRHRPPAPAVGDPAPGSNGTRVLAAAARATRPVRGATSAARRTAGRGVGSLGRLVPGAAARSRARALAAAPVRGLRRAGRLVGSVRLPRRLAAPAGAPGVLVHPTARLRRRRRVLAALAALAVLTLLGVAAGLLPIWVQPLADLLLVGDLVHLRRARQRDAVARRRARLAAAAAEQPADPGRDVRTGTWTPTPWPLPTYVTKSPAPRVVTVDPGEALGGTDEPAAEGPEPPRRAVGS